MSEKVLITGATGLIGKEALLPLLERGFEVFATSRNEINNDSIRCLQGSLFDSAFVERVFNDVKPEYLLNFAWITGENYLLSSENYLFEKAGFELLKAFIRNGGKKAVYAGTCFEYKHENKILTENSPLEPVSVYAKCKDSLRQKGEELAAQNGLDFVWGRIFYVLGHGEHKTRFLPALIDALKNNREFSLKTPNDKKDYMYSKDIAKAFVTLLESQITGCVNVCTGEGISVYDLAMKAAIRLQKEHLIKVSENLENKEYSIVGDNTKLCSSGFVCDYTLDGAIENILAD